MEWEPKREDKRNGNVVCFALAWMESKGGNANQQIQSFHRAWAGEERLSLFIWACRGALGPLGRAPWLFRCGPPPLQPHSTLFLQSHLFISLLNQLFISFIINGREKEKSPWIGWRACFLFWLVAVRLLPPITNQKTTQCATNQFH